jgi:putative nucleotidyltransferase with HDIG domain
MSKPLAVLNIEDSEGDSQLIRRLLDRAGYTGAFMRVETAAQMRAALETNQWDVIISDYRLPQFDGEAALALLQEMGLDIPFIAVSGTIGEELAVAMMRAGAHDYLMKDNLPRLIPAIERELVQAQVRRERRQAQRRIEIQIQRLGALREIDATITGTLDLQAILEVLVNQATIQLDMDAASVLLLNPRTLMLEYAAGCGFRTRNTESAQIRLGESLAGRAALQRRTIQLVGVHQELESLEFAVLWEAEEFASYYGVPLIVKGEVKGVLEVFHRALYTADSEWIGFLETLAEQAAIAIDSAQLFQNLQSSNLELFHAYDATIEGWSRALDMRDRETEGHTQRVTELTMRLARAIGLGGNELVSIRWGALLHDIGKLGVPDSILHKPGPLTDEEWVIMRSHPKLAYDMLSPIAYLHQSLDIPYCHHEKWDGTGYPNHLQGETIPLAARLFAVVDVWDALRSDRPYRAGWPMEKVLDHIQSLSGSHFDPHAVELFLRLGDGA